MAAIGGGGGLKTTYENWFENKQTMKAVKVSICC